MGCGTALLAILAYKMGANPIQAIDNEAWAFNNAKKNIVANHAEEIHVELGDASLLKNKNFDFIMANINRNILLNDIPTYHAALNKNGVLMLSGFYEKDLAIINEKTTQFDLKFQRYVTLHNWCASVYIKS